MHQAANPMTATGGGQAGMPVPGGGGGGGLAMQGGAPAGMYSFKPLSTPQQLAQQQQGVGAPAGVSAPQHPGLPTGAGGPGMPMSNGGGPQPGISVGPGGQLVGPGGTPLNAQQLQGILPQSIQQQFRAYQASRGAAGHSPIQPMAMGGGGPSPTMMQINPSQLSNAQAAMGVGGSQMGPPTGMTAPGRMGGVVGPTNPTGQWMNRIGAGGTQRPARYQQEPTDILTKQKLQELIRQVAPNDRLEPEVEELLQDIAEDFVESVTTFACSLAKLRKSDCLDAKDVALHLERNWNLQIPGYSPELDVMAMTSGTSSSSTQSNVASLKRPLPEGHKQRLALVKKTMAMQRKREEKEREKERKQREDQKEREKLQLQQQQQQAQQQAKEQLEKATPPPAVEEEPKKETTTTTTTTSETATTTEAALAKDEQKAEASADSTKGDNDNNEDNDEKPPKDNDESDGKDAAKAAADGERDGDDDDGSAKGQEPDDMQTE